MPAMGSMWKLVRLAAVAMAAASCQTSPSPAAEQTAPSAEPSSKPVAATAPQSPPTSALTASAASAAPAAPLPAPTNVTTATNRQRCHDAARACAKALLAADDDKIVACMPQQALALAGGREQTIADMRRGRAQMNRDGVAFEAADIQPPKDVISSGGELFAVLPERLTMRVPKGRVVQDSYLLGISLDEGTSWKFVDGATLSHRNVSMLFPSFPSTLTLPVVAEPRPMVHR
jgi:hypothetical protein